MDVIRRRMRDERGRKEEGGKGEEGGKSVGVLKVGGNFVQ
jgi:hypothetical protein